MLQDITKLVTLILGISVASDRLITLIKSIFPSLVAPPGSAAPGPPAGQERNNRISLIIISFICCLLTTFIVSNSGIKFPLGDGSWSTFLIGFIALMATGGSAFWTNILGYLSALKDATNIKALQAKADYEAFKKGSTHSAPRHDERRLRTGLMKTVTFTVAFEGGDGTLKIDIPSINKSLKFTQDGSQDVDLPIGEVEFNMGGAASPGTNGSVTLKISGARASNSPIQRGPGEFPTEQQAMLV